MGLCVFECVSMRLCFSACLWVLHDFVYNLYEYVNIFFSLAVIECGHVSVSNSRMLNVCECFLCLLVFQTNAPAGGRHNRDAGRQAHHGSSQPQRRPLMVPSIGQYLQVAWEDGNCLIIFRFFFLLHNTKMFVTLLKPPWAALCLQITFVSMNHVHAFHFLIFQKLLRCSSLKLLWSHALHSDI